MALPDDELRLIRVRVTWTPPSDGQLEDAWERLGRSWPAVAREYVVERLHTLLADPASLTIPGQISLNTAANIAGLQKALAELDGMLPGAAVQAGRLRRVGQGR